MAILGVGGSSVDILDTLRDINAAAGAAVLECACFLDDDESRWGTRLHGVEVRGPLEAARDIGDECGVVNGIGSPASFWRKRAIIARTGLPAERFVTIVHPTASVSTTARLGPGTVVFQNVTITSNVRIGQHVIILPSSVISHDDEIGDYTSIAGGVCLAGNVKVGGDCYLGMGASVIEGATIGNGCLVGMGSVVLDDVPDHSVVVGNPARIIVKQVGDRR